MAAPSSFFSFSFSASSSSTSCSSWEEHGDGGGRVATACKPAGGEDGGWGEQIASLGKPPAGVEAAGVSPQENRSNSMPESGEVRAGVRKCRWRQRQVSTH